jgi:hypothetical protein
VHSIPQWKSRIHHTFMLAINV